MTGAAAVARNATSTSRTASMFGDEQERDEEGGRRRAHDAGGDPRAPLGQHGLVERRRRQVQAHPAADHREADPVVVELRARTAGASPAGPDEQHADDGRRAETRGRRSP